MTPFEKWWSGDNNPAKTLPCTTQDQIKFIARAAFAAGSQSERNRRVIRDADIISARNMFRDKPL